MSAFDPSTQDRNAALTDFDVRPDGCACLASFEDVPCWPCFRAGFDDPNPNATDD